MFHKCCQKLNIQCGSKKNSSDREQLGNISWQQNTQSLHKSPTDITCSYKELYGLSQIPTVGAETQMLACFATALAKSLHVSVLPVPAGPSGAPPRFNCNAPIRVLWRKQ